MAEIRFIEPLDVMFPRGNKLFGDAGQHGEAQMPPWPSVAAGAIRSRMLADAAVDLAAFGQGRRPEGPLGNVLGTPVEPGSFRLTWFSVARRNGKTVEPILPLPADVIADENQNRLFYLKPQTLPDRFQASHPMHQLPVLHQTKSTKAQSGLWLNGTGLVAYLRGEPLQKATHTMRTSELWKSDPRLGIALDPVKRTAEEGRLYTTEGIAPHENIGFLVSISGGNDMAPKEGLIRLGGDGRGARVTAREATLSEPDWERIARERRFRLVLTTPGLFEKGWRLPGLQDDGAVWRGPDGLTARLISAAVSRLQVVSGWDLARREPKPALRSAPAGSVYWLEAPKADGAALVRALRILATKGFGCMSAYPDKARLAEGFNNVMVANLAAESA